MKVGKFLKQHRQNKNLTLSQVSQATGLSVSFLSDIERERTAPSIKTLNKLSIVYGVKLTLEEQVEQTDTMSALMAARDLVSKTYQKDGDESYSVPVDLWNKLADELNKIGVPYV